MKTEKFKLFMNIMKIMIYGFWRSIVAHEVQHLPRYVLTGA